MDCGHAARRNRLAVHSGRNRELTAARLACARHGDCSGNGLDVIGVEPETEMR